MSKASATVRMYRLNELGDCFLLAFGADGAKSRMLIDCGSFRNGKPSVDRLKAIVDAIGTELGGAPLDVIVGTHQHNDHLSGFVHCKDKFKGFGAKQVWLSWLDDPADIDAKKIGKDHANLHLALTEARQALTGPMAGAVGSHVREVLDDVLGFYGAALGAAGPPVVPADGVKVLKSLGETKYLNPGEIIDMPGMPPGSVRIYVLGPPREHDLLYDKDPKKGESYDHSLAASALSARALAAHAESAKKLVDAIGNRKRSPTGDEIQYPFGDSFKKSGNDLKRGSFKTLIRHYRSNVEALPRRIDDDWLDQAESLALYLDAFTNNSSLTLAIELVESGKVLLFAADAQTGNWLSWSTVKWEKAGVTLDDLLARTVLYKVGHHASHNATLVQAFEKMTHPNLVALIPVHKQDPNITKPNGWKMPATNLFKKLVERTHNRVLQMDNVNPPECNPAKDPAKSSWQKVGIKPKITDLFIELEFAG